MAASTLQVEPVSSSLGSDYVAVTVGSKRELCFRPAASCERADALSLLYGARTPRGREVLFRWAGRLKKEFPNPFSELLIAERAGEMVGVVWGVPAFGRQASVVPPVVMADEPGHTKRELIAALDASLARNRDVAFASTALECESDSAAAVLSNGFNYITEIAKLARDVSNAKAVAVESSLEFEPFGLADAERLKSILLRASADSLDCPRLRGLRSVDDIFSSHFNRRGLVPSHWHIVRHHGQDVGCLLVSCHMNQADCDVVYLGLVAEARGKGWGRTLIHRAIQIAQSTAATRLLLDCDVNNSPAVRTYSAAGFREIQRWAIFAKAYPQPMRQDEQPATGGTAVVESAERLG